MDTVANAVLEISDRLNKQGERIVSQDKTIAVAEHRVKQTSAEIDEKMEKYNSTIEGIKKVATGFTSDLDKIHAELISDRESNRVALAELSDLMQTSVDATKKDRVLNKIFNSCEQKSIFWSKIKILLKNQNFGQKSEF